MKKDPVEMAKSKEDGCLVTLVKLVIGIGILVGILGGSFLFYG